LALNNSNNVWAGSTSQGEMDPAQTPEMLYSRALEVTLRRLNASQRTRYELERTLEDKGIPESIAESVLDRVAEMGYINDSEFAQLWVRSRFRARGLAPSVLRRELMTKGVDREIIELALAEIDPAESLNRARELAAKKLRGLSRLDSGTAIRRITSQLLRKGYSSAVSLAVAREVVATDPDAYEPHPI